MITTSLLGFIFWTVSSHVWEASALGSANALLSLGGAASLLASQGLVPTLLQQIPSSRREEIPALFWLSIGLALIFSVVTSMIFVVCVIHVSDAFSNLGSPFVLLAFLGFASSQSCGMIVDACAIGLGQRNVMMARNAIQSSAKLAVIILLAVADVQTNATYAILGATSVSGFSSIGVAAWMLSIGKPGRLDLEHVRGIIRSIGGAFGWNHVAGVAAAAPQYLLAIVITIRSGPAMSAYFSIAWLVGSLAFMLSPAIAQAVLAEGFRERDAVAKRLRLATRLSFAAIPLPVLVLVIGGGQILHWFGPDYAGHARLCLAVLALCALPDTLANVLVSALRLYGLLPQAALVNVLILALSVILGWFLAPSLGIGAVAAGWGSAQLIGAICGGCLLVLGRQVSAGRHRRNSYMKGYGPLPAGVNSKRYSGSSR
ncbi:lipopolysaccharide biosynthesis protein [Frankia sp. ACN1ag]|uniref:lipopolysaccharide biosynthesis protein n=1 Tax=Frankia sp. ACN1ag TaxID=102891 RepID=UPI00128F5459|nr:hypothetical protein [Frankia sp. ACN1ag]